MTSLRKGYRRCVRCAPVPRQPRWWTGPVVQQASRLLGSWRVGRLKPMPNQSAWYPFGLHTERDWCHERRVQADDRERKNIRDKAREQHVRLGIPGNNGPVYLSEIGFTPIGTH